MLTNATPEQIHNAVRLVSDEYDGNVVVKNISQKSKNRWNFIVTVKKSGVRGAKKSPSGRNVHAASWHVYGHVIDRLLENEGVFVQSFANKIINKNENWKDFNVGSMVCPCYASDTSIEEDE